MVFSLVIPQITDISGLQTRLDFWELFDRIALIVVFLGVLGELLAEFTNVFNVLVIVSYDKAREPRNPKALSSAEPDAAPVEAEQGGVAKPSMHL
jgi:hypothetical protein